MTANTDGVPQMTGACPWSTSAACVIVQFHRYISAPTVKGAMPAVGNITYTDDLSVASLFPNLSSADRSAITGNLTKYGPRLYQARPPEFGWFDAGFTESGTAAYSVVNSGTTVYTNSGGTRVDGTNQPVNGVVTGTISGADMSLSRIPTMHNSVALPDPTVAYAVAGVVDIVIPIATFTDFGAVSGRSYTLYVANSYQNFMATGLTDALGGTPTETSAQQPSSQGYTNGTWNDSRQLYIGIQIGRSGFGAGLVGSIGYPNSYGYNTSPFPGPPGNWNGFYHSGQVRVTQGTSVSTLLYLEAQDVTGPPKQAQVACASWTPSQMQLKSSSQYTSTADYTATGFPGVYALAQYWGTVSSIQVQYSATQGSSANGYTCADGTWYNTPSAADTAAGKADVTQSDGSVLYPGVARVRVLLVTTWPVAAGVPPNQYLFVGQQIVSATDGQTIIMYATYKVDMTGATVDPLVLANNATGWYTSTYATTAPSDTKGDSFIVTRALARHTQTVLTSTYNPTTGAYAASGSAKATATAAISYADGRQGDQVTFNLTPTLTDQSGATTTTGTVVLEDCLPSAFTLNSVLQNGVAVPASQIVTAPVGGTLPSGSTITCNMAQNSYVRVTLSVKINVAIPVVQLVTRVAITARPGAVVNTSVVSSAGVDSSAIGPRTTTTTVTLVAPETVSMIKQADASQVQVNRTGQTTNQGIAWNLALTNTIPNSTGLTNPVFIDVLPSTSAPSSYVGTLTLTKVTPTAGSPTLWYSATPASQVSTDPTAASNSATGATTWCNAASGGTRVSGAATGAACPASLSAVTAIRVSRTGTFLGGDALAIRVEMTPSGNATGNTYVNQSAGFATGLGKVAGPVNSTVTALGSALGDFVWDDLNGNGIQDAGEPGVAGVKVTLSGRDDLNNVVSGTATTDTNGKYSFPNLRASSTAGYTLTFDKSTLTPAGSSWTAATQGSDTAKDSNANVTTGATAAVVLPVSTTNNSIDAGLYWPATVSGKAWTDASNDGVIDAGEPALSGVKVCLTGKTGTGASLPATCTTTNTSGLYSFSVPPSDSAGYTVGFTAPTDALFSPVPATPSATTSRANPSTGLVTIGAVTSGQTVPNINAGFHWIANVTGVAWGDVNANGAIDSGETGMPGVSVCITGFTGANVNITSVLTGGANCATTAADGSYGFMVPAGPSYTLTFTAPSGHVFSSGTDSRVNTSGVISGVSVSGNQNTTVTGLDAGLYTSGSLSGVVWVDTNADSVHQASETGTVGGVGVCVTGTTGAGVNVTTVAANGGCTTTAADGTWSLTVPPAGSAGYTVQFSPPAGAAWIVSPTGVGKDSKANPAGQVLAVGVASGQHVVGIDVGLHQAAGISGTAWVDNNADGVINNADAGLVDVTVCASGTTGTGATLTGACTTTAADGTYSLSVPPSSAAGYTVTFTKPVGWFFSSGTNSVVDASGVKTAVVVASGGAAGSIDAGLYTTAQVSGVVWNDTNANGTMDMSETGYANAHVCISGDTGAGVPVSDPGGVTPYCVDTDATGQFSFTVPPSGPFGYSVLVAPTGLGWMFSPTTTTSLVASPTQSVVNSVGLASGIHVLSDVNVVGVNAGLYQKGTLAGLAWLDNNADGVINNADAGLGGVQVCVGGTQGSGVALPQQCVTTPAGGTYSFSVPPSDAMGYTLTFTPPASS
ncbi:MAG: hypothetical protein FWD80_03390, partial [Propionibacteriaceae bacterium]|nr:hypothetical protein [Propionibacteriaceae bacterium]